jgi:hypothetical protein
VPTLQLNPLSKYSNSGSGLMSLKIEMKRMANDSSITMMRTAFTRFLGILAKSIEMTSIHKETKKTKPEETA